MGSPYKTFKLDEHVVLEYSDGYEIYISPVAFSNKVYQRELAKQQRKYRRQMKHDNISPEKLLKINIEIYAKSIIKGWKDVEDENGEEIPFSYENCVKLMSDLPNLFQDIQEQAESIATFRNDTLEEEAKNL